MLRQQPRAASITYAFVSACPRRPLRTATIPRLLLALLLAATVIRAADPSPFEPHWQYLKSTLSNEDLYRLMWALPKGGDIHNHHEYSVPMSFWLDSAARHSYSTRAKIGNCGESEPLQWLTLRQDSVRKLPACQLRQLHRPHRIARPAQVRQHHL